LLTKEISRHPHKERETGCNTLVLVKLVKKGEQTRRVQREPCWGASGDLFLPKSNHAKCLRLNVFWDCGEKGIIVSCSLPARRKYINAGKAKRYENLTVKQVP
jgi:hypothetical protein